ncbi:MAG: ABC transporter ATP-binding protein [Gammaproteobacteria bacterium]|nr:ABC transporter ATP-binding protein [Gammaproteobacteria bacterium]
MNALFIDNLHKTYHGGHVALKGISLEVNKGDFFALLGPNGAGKSTTIGIICSLVNKTSGTVEVFNNNIDVDIQTAKSHIGLVPQEYNFNVFEPIEEILINQAGFYGISGNVARQRAEYYLKKLELWDKRRQIPKELSGGMKRRLMIARALVHQPDLLILDEPTAGVDIELRRTMWQFLRDINADGVTIILTTHYLEEAEMLCNNIAIINDGEIIENTSMKALLAKLNKETFVLYVDGNLERLPSSEDYALRCVDENTIEAEVIKGQSLNLLFEMLTRHKINILSMRNKSNRLEELYVALVNKT